MLWENVWNAMPAAIAGEDPEGVHAVRVASRRLRAGMATATGYFPQKWYRRLHETARDITGDLGAVRDRDVLLEALANIRSGRLSSQERTALDHLIARVTAERDAARQTLLAFVADLDMRGIRAETQRRFAAPVAKPPLPAAKISRGRKRERNRTQRRATRLRLAADARHALKPRIAELFAFDQVIRDPDRVREHHRARIAAKRLRYTLELFADQFGDAGERAIQEMKELQEELGVIHDIDVRIALIDDEGLRLAPGGGVDPRLAAGFAKLRERQGKLRGEHHLALVDRWTRLEEAGFRRDLRRLTRKKP
jgi:CHAD domain-containing protein